MLKTKIDWLIDWMRVEKIAYSKYVLVVEISFNETRDENTVLMEELLCAYVI